MTIPLRRIALGVGPAAALVVISAWDLVATLHAPGEPGDDPAWSEAEKAVRSRYKPGDLIVFAPKWIDPIGRQHLGDLIPLDVAGRMDAATFKTIWEVSTGGQHPETAGLKPGWESRHETLRVRRYDRKAEQALTDFVEAFATARVQGAHAQPPIVDLVSIQFEPRRCLRLVVGEDGPASVAYAGVLLGDRLVGYVGLVDEFPRLRHRTERGQLTVFVNGKQVAHVDVTGPWTRFVADTTPGEGAEVELRATASGPRGHERLVCFAAQARR
jgi:hypothetical protein